MTSVARERDVSSNAVGEKEVENFEWENEKKVCVMVYWMSQWAGEDGAGHEAMQRRGHFARVERPRKRPPPTSNRPYTRLTD